MKKIDKILMYNLSIFESAALKECDMVNGCGWKGGVNFDEIVLCIIKSLKNYNHKELDELWSNFTKICNEHDLDFRLQRWFILSNFRMCKKVYLLCKDWAWKKQSFWLAFTIFWLLHKYWKEYYKKADPLYLKK